ncbi:H-2 class II histocompatibility antigen, A-F alpha chain-like isoform X2 [Esox lucius]|uniref:H-2 class II histocompatibility antigen, A-F alpha chain-like isoform X2 n=1 Tax=Esox lucius TaxID=8010 RepID=UPI00147696F7|nr:H-2 class II histocompatibility antigen, A-F alpha chain-like isoform X2 [Esox lucius]
MSIDGMMSSVFVILLLGVISAQEPAVHVYDVIKACSETEQFNMIILVDDEEYGYVDLKKNATVTTLPDFATPVDCPICLTYAEQESQRAEREISIFSKETQEAKVRPDVMLYPKEEVAQGTRNSLVCFVNNFFPPPVQVKWTKNDENITERAEAGRYATNSDNTFYHFSTLTFTPEEGDIYTCTVEHPALDNPLTKIWDQAPANLTVV